MNYEFIKKDVSAWADSEKNILIFARIDFTLLKDPKAVLIHSNNSFEPNLHR